jgi:hypothetical protein
MGRLQGAACGSRDAARVSEGGSVFMLMPTAHADRAPPAIQYYPGSSIYVELHISRLMCSTWLCGVARRIRGKSGLSAHDNST